MPEEKKQFGNVSTSEKAHEIAADGSFQRQENHFRTPFGDKEGELPVEAGRYRLIWTPLCPWATRQVIAIKLLGLEDVISIGQVANQRGVNGWPFSTYPDGKDPVLGISYLPEIYAETDPDYQGRATVPTVVDVKIRKVVNNDYHRLTNYWETAFAKFHKEGAPDLYPEELREQIDALNEIIFNEVNNGVYKCGFAQSQEAYEKNYDILFARLDWLEERLSKQRFLFGDQITDSDIRLYVTLARFDIAYYPTFRCNRNLLVDFPNLWAYARDLYSIPAFREATDFDAINEGYNLHEDTNPFNIKALGPGQKIWEEPNHRAEQFS